MEPHLSHAVIRPSVGVAANANGYAICPLCHTADSRVTDVPVSGGGDWHCAQCGQSWDARRLDAVANYGVWLAERPGTRGLSAGSDRRP